MIPFPLDPQDDPELRELSTHAITGLEAARDQSDDVRWLTLRGGLMSDISPVTLPDELRRYSNLEVLELEYFQSVHLTDAITELPKLHTMILLGNEFRVGGTTIGEHVKNVQELRALYMDCFSPLKLTRAFGSCTRLRKLWIDDCELQGAEFLGELTQLEELSIDFDLAEHLPKLTGLRRLRLIRSEPPPDCIQGLRLETLALHRMRVATLPAWVGELDSLTELDLFQSDVSELPAGFPALRGLCVSGTPLADKVEELQARFPEATIVC